MGRVHVHQHQPLGVLGEDVDTLELRKGVAQRRDVPWLSGCRRLIDHRREVFAVGALGLGGGEHRRWARRLVAGTGAAMGRRPGGLADGLFQHGRRQAHFTLGPELARLDAGGSNHAADSGGSGELVLGPHLAKSAVQGAIKEVVDHAAFAEAHLVLGRVDVDVYHRRVHFQEQHEGRVPAVVEHIAAWRTACTTSLSRTMRPFT